ncbi:MAG: hypothetical protein ACHQ3P_07135 [Candidatus Limnocylindrales bacterium]
MRWIRAFFDFWYDFLVGDRPELFLGPIAVLIVVWASVSMGADPMVSATLMVLGVIAVGSLSLVLQTRARP